MNFIKELLVTLCLLISFASVGQTDDDGGLPIQTLSALAKSYYSKGNYSEAIKNYSEILKRLPNNITALELRGVCYYDSKMYDLAIADYSKVLRVQPSDHVYYNRALAYDYKGDYDNAIKDYTQAIQLKPTYTNAYFKRGIAYYNRKLYNEAKADFTIVTTLDPKKFLAFYNRGLIHSELKNYDNAIADYTETLNLNPQYLDAFLSRASSYFSIKLYDKAIADYDVVLQLDPKRDDALYNKGAAYINLGQKDKAIAEFSKLIKLNPSYILAYEQRGEMYLQSNRFEEAIADFNEAIRLNPKSRNYYAQRGRAYYGAGKYDKAIGSYNDFIEGNPGNSIAHYLRGLAYLGAKNQQKALDDFTKAIKYDAKNDNAYLQLGWLHYLNGEYAKAIEEYKKALVINPANAYGYWYIGIAHFYSGNAETAIENCTEALALDPKNPYILTSRAGAYVYLGKYKEAIRDYEKSMTIDPTYYSTYIDFFTVLLHTGQIREAKKLYEEYKRRGIKRDDSDTDWKFYEHYVNALTEGIFQNSFEKALSELKLAEQKFETGIIADHKKNQAKFGYVDILFLKGYVNEQLGILDKASMAYEQALLINKNQHDVRDAIQRLNNKAAVAIKLDKTPPTIELISPKLSRSIEVVPDATEKEIRGTARDVSGIKSVTINGKAVKELETTDQIGHFNQLVNLSEGSNVITIEAIDNNDNKTTETFTLTVNKTEPKKVENRKPEEPKNLVIEGGKPRYHAIIIGEEDYSYPFQKLNNPVQDARKLKRVLETYYTFEPENVQLLENKSQQEIMSAIIRKCNTLDSLDNLIIFYAGHGDTIKNRMGKVEGYWVPTSAKEKSVEYYIKDMHIKEQLYGSRAQHILIIADACFAGTLMRSAVAEDAPKDIKMQYESRSRKAMTSGNLSAVDDVSTFMAHLLDRLEKNRNKYFSAYDLFHSIREIVFHSGSKPMYEAIPLADHFGGEFIFIRRN